MKLQLRPYQIECLQFLRKWNGRAIIGDAPGVGKTIEGLSWLIDNPIKHLPAIIVCTATAKNQWLEEWEAWIGATPIKILNGTTPYHLDNNTSYIINWEILRDWGMHLPRTNKTIIADEFHHAGNSKAHRTKALSWLSKYSPYFIPMSGTPVLSRPGQFYPILHMIDPERFSSELTFQHKYCNLDYDNYTGRIVEKPGGKNLKELNFILKDYMIRREKREVLKDLPRKLRTPIPLEIKNKKEYDTLDKMARATIYNSNVFTGTNVLRNLKRSAFDFKKDAIVAWIEDFLTSEESLIVFAFHKAVLSFLENHFGNKCVRIDGDVKGKHRINAIKSFKEKKKQLLIGQMNAMGESLDGFQKVCSACVFVEFGQTTTVHDQAESRLERSGQARGVNCYYLIAKDTIDEDQMFVLDQQTKMLNKLLKGESAQDVDLLTKIYYKWRDKND